MKQTLLYLITFLTVFPVFAEKYDLSRFEREILIKSSRDAIQFEVLANGDIVFVEFAGEVKWWEAKSRTVRDIGLVPTYAKTSITTLSF